MLKAYLKGHAQHRLLSVICQQYGFIVKATTTATGSVAEETSSIENKPSTASALSKVLDGLPKFTQEENVQILDIVNNSTADQLLRYDITKSRANKLHNWKVRNGPLLELQDIIYVDGFSLKSVTKFYKSLLAPALTSTAPKSKTRTAPFVTPLLDEQTRSSIRSCVSVRVGVSSVTWARLALPTATSVSGPCTLTNWQHHEIAGKKLHLNELVQHCLYVAHQIPTADCYLFESPQMAQASNNPGSVEQQNINIQKAQVIAVMSFALTARAAGVSEEDQATVDVVDPELKPYKGQRVYYLRRFLTARLFNHLVGTERVSSEETVLKLMRTYYNLDAREDYMEDQEAMAIAEKESLAADLSVCGNVHFPMPLRNMFAQAERYHREFLGQSLLLNLAFVRLVLLQDPTSIATVSNRGGKKTDVPDTF